MMKASESCKEKGFATHSNHLLGGLDRKTVGLDGGTGTGGLSLLVLALDLGALAFAGVRGIEKHVQGS